MLWLIFVIVNLLYLSVHFNAMNVHVSVIFCLYAEIAASH